MITSEDKLARIKQITDVVSRVLGVPRADVKVGQEYTLVSCSMSVNYDKLLLLANELGTTKIDFVYREGEPGYSSWTPGSDGSFELTIGIGTAT